MTRYGTKAEREGRKAAYLRFRRAGAGILAFGREVAAMPVLDPRSPNEIADDLNEI
jgi:hypothetical protein